MVESRNVVFIETPPNLLPAARRLSQQQNLESPLYDFNDDTLDDSYVSLDGMLWDVHNYTSARDLGVDTPAATVELLLSQEASPGLTLHEGASPAGIMPRGVTPEGSSPPPAPAPAPRSAPTPASAAPRETNGHANHGTVGVSRPPLCAAEPQTFRLCLKAARHTKMSKIVVPRSMTDKALSWRSRRARKIPSSKVLCIPEKRPRNLAQLSFLVGPRRKETDRGQRSAFPSETSQFAPLILVHKGPELP